MTNTGRHQNITEQMKTASAEILALMLARNFPVNSRTVNELWSEMATHNTYGDEAKFSVWFVRKAERGTRAEYWLKRVQETVFRQYFWK